MAVQYGQQLDLFFLRLLATIGRRQYVQSLYIGVTHNSCANVGS